MIEINIIQTEFILTRLGLTQILNYVSEVICDTKAITKDDVFEITIRKYLIKYYMIVLLHVKRSIHNTGVF